MVVDQLLDEFGNGGFTEATPSEAAFKHAWQSRSAGLSPHAMALQAGFLADRLSWVFLGGYQSAIRSCFPNVPDGEWATFAYASSANDGRLPLPRRKIPLAPKSSRS